MFGHRRQNPCFEITVDTARDLTTVSTPVTLVDCLSGEPRTIYVGLDGKMDSGVSIVPILRDDKDTNVSISLLENAPLDEWEGPEISLSYQMTDLILNKVLYFSCWAVNEDQTRVLVRVPGGRIMFSLFTLVSLGDFHSIIDNDTEVDAYLDGKRYRFQKTRVALKPFGDALKSRLDKRVSFQDLYDGRI